MTSYFLSSISSKTDRKEQQPSKLSFTSSLQKNLGKEDFLLLRRASLGLLLTEKKLAAIKFSLWSGGACDQLFFLFSCLTNIQQNPLPASEMVKY